MINDNRRLINCRIDSGLTYTAVCYRYGSNDFNSSRFQERCDKTMGRWENRLLSHIQTKYEIVEVHQSVRFTFYNLKECTLSTLVSYLNIRFYYFFFINIYIK